MKIVINSKENKKLLENFPDDQYSDVQIITNSSKLNLVLAYLSIDSQFFAEVQTDVKQINLSHFPQEALIKVLKSLYGAQLIAYSIQQLVSIYEVIEKLQIEEYKTYLKQSIQNILTLQKDNPILNSIEMLQFCIQKDVMAKQMKNFHFDMKLKILETSKNYLQLNKLSQSTLSSLLIDFNSLGLEKGDTIINHIMENYFTRKNIRPAIYFADQSLRDLKEIWQKHHHKINVTEYSGSMQSRTNSGTLTSTMSNFSRNTLSQFSNKSQMMRNSQCNFDSMLKVPNQVSKSQLFKSDTLTQSEKLDDKIKKLEVLSQQKDILIQQLKSQLLALKQKKTFLDVDSDRQDTEASLLVNLKISKKNKQTAIKDLQGVRQVQSFEGTRQFNNAARVIGKGNLQGKRSFPEFTK